MIVNLIHKRSSLIFFDISVTFLLKTSCCKQINLIKKLGPLLQYSFIKLYI